MPTLNVDSSGAVGVTAGGATIGAAPRRYGTSLFGFASGSLPFGTHTYTVGGDSVTVAVTYTVSGDSSSSSFGSSLIDRAAAAGFAGVVASGLRSGAPVWRCFLNPVSCGIEP